MLKKHWIFLFLALCIAACSFGKPEGKSHMMWEIRTPESTVFLVGSIHIADSSFYPLDNIYYEKLDSSEIFVSEIDMDNIDPFKIIKLIMLRDGTKLEDHLSKESYKFISEKLESLGYVESDYQKFKPGYAVILASLADDSTNTANHLANMQEGIDLHLKERAKDYPKLALEDVGTQMILLEKIIDVDSKKIELYLNADPNESSIKNIAALKEAWKNSDIDKIAQSLEDTEGMDEETAALMDELLHKRNVNMAEKIDSYIVDGGKFYIVIGAGHLCGEDSVIELLEDKGYTVNQL